MDKKLIGALVFVLVLIGIGVFSYMSATEKASLQEQEAMKQTQLQKEAMMREADAVADKMATGTEAMMKKDAMQKDGAMMQKAGTYEVYSPEKLVKAEQGKVVLFFRASWCPTCRALDADIRAHLSSIPAGLTILDVNYDDSKALKQKYGVTYQHTFVQVDAQGIQLAKWSASPTLAELVTHIK